MAISGALSSHMYGSHACWYLGMLQVRSGDGHPDLGKMVLIHDTSLSFSFISSNMSRKKQ